MKTEKELQATQTKRVEYDVEEVTYRDYRDKDLYFLPRSKIVIYTNDERSWAELHVDPD